MRLGWSRARLAALPILLLLALPDLASAQGATLASIRGHVVDADGRPVTSARVELRDTATGRVSGTVSGADGRFFISNLPAGRTYTLTAETSGYQPAMLDALVLQAGRIHDVTLTLEFGAIELPELQVQAAAGLRGSSAGALATNLDSAEIRGFPTLERDLTGLAGLSHLARGTRDGFSFAGQNPRFNAVRVDGFRHQDVLGAGSSGGAGAKPLPLDAVDELQLIVATYDVRESGFSGGLLNAVTRGGTNQARTRVFGHYRDRRFAGTQEAVPQWTPLGNFSNYLVGASLSGPIRKDVAHYSLAVELEGLATPSPGYNMGAADPFTTGIAPDSVDRLAEILRTQYGIDTGSWETLLLRNPRENLFGRVDWKPGRHHVIGRLNSAWARRDEEPGRDVTGPYDLGSYMRRLSTASHAVSVQVLSDVRQGLSNDFATSMHYRSDRALPTSFIPSIEVTVTSQFDTLTGRRLLRAGGHSQAHASTGSQLMFDLRNSLTGLWGRHVFAAGAGVELGWFSGEELPSAHGRYIFPSLAALEANRPARFERVVTEDGYEGNGLFVTHLSAFVQDYWTPHDRLDLNIGVLVELPYLKGRTIPDPDLAREMGLATPTTAWLSPSWSPRIGATWLTADSRTRLRGGAGIMSGRPPYAWLAQAVNRSGSRTALLTCDISRAPRLDATRSPPDECAPVTYLPSGPPAPGEARITPLAAMLASDFSFPRDLRASMGADRAFAGNAWMATADLVYTRSLRQVFFRDVNLGPPLESTSHLGGHSDGFGFEERVSIGTPVPAGFAPIRRSDAFGQVIQMGNASGNRALSFSLGIGGRIGDTDLRGAYNWSRSIDRQSLNGSDIAAIVGNMPTVGDPRVPLAVLSDFDRPHRLLLGVSGPVPGMRGTRMVVHYSAESGAPYTFVYDLDINGDGMPGPIGPTAYNDPVYIPVSPTEFPGSFTSARYLDQLVGSESCLARWRGRVLPRNACRGPAVHQLDLQVSRDFVVKARSVRVVADLINVLSLLGAEAGNVRSVPVAVPILSVETPRSTAGGTDTSREPLHASYAGPLQRMPDGTVRPLPVHTLDPAASRWQARLGLSVDW